MVASLRQEESVARVGGTARQGLSGGKTIDSLVSLTRGHKRPMCSRHAKAARLVTLTIGGAKPLRPLNARPNRFRQAGLPAQGCFPLAFPSMPIAGSTVACTERDAGGLLDDELLCPPPITAARPRWNPRPTFGRVTTLPFSPERLVHPSARSGTYRWGIMLPRLLRMSRAFFAGDKNCRAR